MGAGRKSRPQTSSGGANRQKDSTQWQTYRVPRRVATPSSCWRASRHFATSTQRQRSFASCGRGPPPGGGSPLRGRWEKRGGGGGGGARAPGPPPPPRPPAGGGGG